MAGAARVEPLPPVTRAGPRFHHRREIGTLVGLVALLVALWGATPHFATVSNLVNVVEQSTIIGIVAVGMTFVIVSGGIDLSVGSVVALAGIVFGLDRLDGGRILVRGRPLRIRSPRHAIRAGIGFVTEDRKGDGLVLGLSVRDNIALPVLRALSRMGVVRAAAERALAGRYVRELRIRTSGAEQRAVELSGGNQQKVVLAKWLAARVDVLFLDEPTRGIDVGSKQEIYRLIGRLAAEGVGIVLISSELPEIVGLADRVLVMRGGRVAGEFARAEATQERLLACAVGA